MKVLFTLLFIFWQTYLLAELVETKNTLKAGSSVEFYPKQGESLAITKDLNHLVSGANYDIVMKNGKRVYFRNKNQEDDMYIVFNEPTSLGDVVIVKVNHGYFTYTTQAFHTLPKSVQKVLKASAKRKKIKKRAKHSKDAIVKTEEFCFDNRGEICECSSPEALINQQTLTSTSVKKESISSPLQRVSLSKNKESDTNIFKTFAQKLQEAFSQIKSDLTKPRQEEKPLPKKVIKVEALPVEKVAAKKTDISKKEILKTNSAKLHKYNMLSDHEITAAKQVVKPHFTALPPVVKEEFSFTPLTKQNRVFAPHLQKPENVKISTGYEKTSSIQKPEYMDKLQKPKALEHISAYDDLNKPYKAPEYTSSKPSFTKQQESDIAASTIELPQVSMPKMRKEDIQSQQKKLDIPHYETRPIKQNTKPQFTEPKLVQKPLPSQMQKAATDVHSLPDVAKEEPVAATIAPPVIQKTVKPEVLVSEEENTQEDEVKDKIVITKILDKKKSVQAPVVLERMSDRVLGGGYSDSQDLGKLSVQAYSNRKPVSAWVEVYKGKRRVKTFYTGNKKELKLPVGTYVLKATYRTGTAKQKKNLGKVKLKEGESIHKKVYFNVGKLRIIAKRNAKPVYVKVEIYKKGSKRKYAYTFSSHRTGEANMQLSEGKYKIVVIEHGTKKVFDNVYVKGNSSKILRVEF